MTVFLVGPGRDNGGADGPLRMRRDLAVRIRAVRKSPPLGVPPVPRCSYTSKNNHSYNMSSVKPFAAAFAATFAQPIDRAILIALQESGKELRYEEMRRLLGGPKPQTFQYALDRLMAHAMVSRRLEPHGKSHWSYYQPTTRGAKVASTWMGIADGRTPRGLSKPEIAAVRDVLLGHLENEPVVPA